MKKNSRNNRKRKNKRENAYQLAAMGRYTSYEKPSRTWFDPHKYSQLVYDEFVTISLATVTGVSQVYNLNSLFDPNRTGTGHQPFGFDQISAIYNRYRVLKTRWVLVFSPSSLTYGFAVGPINGLLAASVVDLATYQTACESPLMRNWAQGASGQSKVIQGSIALNDIAGVTPTEYLADDRFEAIVTASPAEVMILEIALYNPGGSTISINFSVTLGFEIDFHDPILPAGST